jgi:hypothetical protein
MKFSIHKILPAFGNKKAIEQTPNDINTDNIIKSIEDKAFAVSEQNVMYASVKDLGGFFYFKTIIVGSFKIKTMKGAKLHVTADDFNLELKTDMDEFESDHSNASHIYMTRIDFQIEEDDIPKLNQSNINKMQLISKKEILDFELYTT